jgi:hypothetical protein
MTHATVPEPKAPSSEGRCGCGGSHVPDTCCELECFERPNYFCGHLLTDEDLSRQQSYSIRKNKLYHRALHGDGIVCGLRLTCSTGCDGAIEIGEGYAIDDCGNDLVVCDDARLDVMALLKKKGWLIAPPPADPCEPDEETPECPVRQCFYVTACYEEVPREFEAPLSSSGCVGELKDCEPTRIRESVRFDVLNTLPKRADPLTDFRERVKHCFSLLECGPFAEAVRKGLSELTAVASGKVTAGHAHYYELFCKLRGLFLLHLDKHPDKYNCRLEDEVRRIPFPQEEDVSVEGAAPAPSERYTEGVRDAFCKLFELVWRHMLSCVFGQLVPSCPEPTKASCVVLGTVVVENGCLVQVCNCPRDYVWSFANFFEVLMASVLGPLACDEAEGDDDCASPCCNRFELDCVEFLRLLHANQDVSQWAAMSGFDALSMLRSALRFDFDFTQFDRFSAGIFANKSREEALLAAEKLGVDARVHDAPLQAMPLGVQQVIQSVGLMAQGQAVLLADDHGHIGAARAFRQPEAVLTREEKAKLEERLRVGQESLEEARERVHALSSEVQALIEREAGLQTTVREMAEHIAELRASTNGGNNPGGDAPTDAGQRYCKAITRSGARCKRLALAGSDFCSVHTS